MAELTALEHARHAAKQNNPGAAHTYYALCLCESPDQGATFAEYLQNTRALVRSPAKTIDVAPDSTLNRLLPSQAPAKTLETALERLKINPFDIDAVHKIGKAAIAAGWHSLAAAALTDVLKNSASARTPASKLRRETRMALGREHFALKEYQAALDALQEFQNDTSAPKDVLQIIKDSAALIASETFSRRESTFNLATKQSISVATKNAKERESDEAAELNATISSPTAEPAKVIAAALRLAEILARSQQFERALEILADVESRTGGPADLAKKSVEINVRKLNHRLDDLRQGGHSVTECEIERDRSVLLAYTYLLKKIPTDGDVRLNLGEALFASWKRSKDEAVLKDAIVQFQFDFKTDDQAYRARLRLAECFLELQLPGAAEVVLSEFLSRLENSKRESHWYIEAQYLLGVVREKLCDRRGATAAYLAVIGKDIRFKDTYERLKTLESTRRE